MTESNAATERQKLLTRARNILLDNNIYTPAQAIETGQYNLTGIANIGEKMARIIIGVACRPAPDDEQEYLFPYPNGDDERPFTATDYADLPYDAVDIGTPPTPAPSPSVKTAALGRALHGLRRYGDAWADGYLSGLIDSAEGVPGFAEIGVQELHGILHPPTPQVFRFTPDIDAYQAELLAKAKAATNGAHLMNTVRTDNEGC
jgi:hypothetical protein